MFSSSYLLTCTVPPSFIHIFNIIIVVHENDPYNILRDRCDWTRKESSKLNTHAMFWGRTFIGHFFATHADFWASYMIGLGRIPSKRQPMQFFEKALWLDYEGAVCSNCRAAYSDWMAVYSNSLTMRGSSLVEIILSFYRAEISDRLWSAVIGCGRPGLNGIRRPVFEPLLSVLNP